MLSPFRGVMHSIVAGWADAVTIDGRNWTLYVRGECLYDDVADLRAQAISVPDVKYGTWSADAGFQRAPIRLPTFDECVRAEGERLLAAVHDHAAGLPFPLADRFELWLLNARSGLPLALIASSCSAADCDAAATPRWTPGQLCMAELPEARGLREVIDRLAGAAPQAHWFERRPDGSGVALVGTRSLPADCFDPLLLDAGSLNDRQVTLLEALHHWQSPALLQLPELSEAQRTRFEAAACRHALRLAGQLPLYPRVIDRAAVTAALVEARLRRSGAPNGATDGSPRTMSPDYIEIPDD